MIVGKPFQAALSNRMNPALLPGGIEEAAKNNPLLAALLASGINLNSLSPNTLGEILGAGAFRQPSPQRPHYPSQNAAAQQSINHHLAAAASSYPLGPFSPHLNNIFSNERSPLVDSIFKQLASSKPRSNEFFTFNENHTRKALANAAPAAPSFPAVTPTAASLGSAIQHLHELINIPLLPTPKNALHLQSAQAAAHALLNPTHQQPILTQPINDAVSAEKTGKRKAVNLSLETQLSDVDVVSSMLSFKRRAGDTPKYDLRDIPEELLQAGSETAASIRPNPIAGYTTSQIPSDSGQVKVEPITHSALELSLIQQLSPGRMPSPEERALAAHQASIAASHAQLQALADHHAHSQAVAEAVAAAQSQLHHGESAASESLFKTPGGVKRKGCKYPKCPKIDKGGGFCKSHGGGRRCGVDGCQKTSRGSSGRCISHGGGPKCTHEGCMKSARKVGGFCKAHGGGKRCTAEGCTKAAREPAAFCIRHGGGVRCQKEGCNTSVRVANSFCKKHGGASTEATAAAGADGGRAAEPPHSSLLVAAMAPQLAQPHLAGLVQPALQLSPHLARVALKIDPHAPPISQAPSG